MIINFFFIILGFICPICFFVKYFGNSRLPLRRGKFYHCTVYYFLVCGVHDFISVNKYFVCHPVCGCGPPCVSGWVHPVPRAQFPYLLSRCHPVSAVYIQLIVRT